MTNTLNSSTPRDHKQEAQELRDFSKTFTRIMGVFFILGCGLLLINGTDDILMMVTLPFMLVLTLGLRFYMKGHAEKIESGVININTPEDPNAWGNKIFYIPKTILAVIPFSVFTLFLPSSQTYDLITGGAILALTAGVFAHDAYKSKNTPRDTDRYFQVRRGMAIEYVIAMTLIVATLLASIYMFLASSAAP
jgi:hypothetical protein